MGQEVPHQLKEINGKVGGTWSGLCDLEIATHPCWVSVSSCLRINVVSELLSHAPPCTCHPFSLPTAVRAENLRDLSQVTQRVPLETLEFQPKSVWFQSPGFSLFIARGSLGVIGFKAVGGEASQAATRARWLGSRYQPYRFPWGRVWVVRAALSPKLLRGFYWRG